MLTVLILLVVLAALLLRLLYAARRFNFVNQERAMQGISALSLIFVAGAVLVVLLLGGDA